MPTSLQFASYMQVIWLITSTSVHHSPHFIHSYYLSKKRQTLFSPKTLQHVQSAVICIKYNNNYPCSHVSTVQHSRPYQCVCVRTPTKIPVQELAAVSRASAYHNWNPLTGTVQHQSHESAISPPAINTLLTTPTNPAFGFIVSHAHLALERAHPTICR